MINRNEKGQFIKGNIAPKTAFKRGHISWLKGKKGYINNGSFKKGHPLLGKGIGEIVRGKISPRKGIKLAQEIKDKISQSINNNIDNKKILRGNEHPNWKGGITPENKKVYHSIYYALWRISVFAKDDWTCQKCKTKGRKLRPHHIKNFAQYPELRFAIDNGIAFCDICHKEFHKKYGQRNNTSEQIDGFIIGQNI